MIHFDENEPLHLKLLNMAATAFLIASNAFEVAALILGFFKPYQDLGFTVIGIGLGCGTAAAVISLPYLHFALKHVEQIYYS